MPILDLQKRFVELGRIRMGEQVEMRGGKTRPAKLETWRLTSADREKIEGVAAVYGGEVREWQSPRGKEYEVITPTNSLAVTWPAMRPGSQWMEKWAGMFLERRCDSETETRENVPCICKASGHELCKPYTRLNFMLRGVATGGELGVWRLETHGWNGAQELGAALEVLDAVGSGFWDANLVIEVRTQTSIRNGKPETRKFPVPRVKNLQLEALLQIVQTQRVLQQVESAPSAGQLSAPPPSGAAGGAPSLQPPPPASGAQSSGWSERVRQEQARANQARRRLDESAEADVVGSSGEATASGPDPVAQPEREAAAGASLSSTAAEGDPVSPESGAMEQLCAELGIPTNRGWLYLRKPEHNKEFADLKSLDDFLALEGERAERATVLLRQQFGEADESE